MHLYLAMTYMSVRILMKQNSSGNSAFAGGTVSKKSTVISSVGKVKACVFWDARGFILFKHLYRGLNYNRGILFNSQ